MGDDDKHRIGYVADRVGLSLRTVRYYEEVGLIALSGRTEGGFRLYTDADIARLELIKRLKPLDFTLDELRDLLDLRDRLSDPTAADARQQLAERLTAYVDVAEQRCQQLRDRLAAVEDVTGRLRREAQRHSAAALGHT